ncbi:MAG: DNA polymerase III subunit gamma/tau [Patescibacteria group bacterium]
MSQTLYRKYRPKNFSEVIGQHHIVDTLVNSIRNDRIAQAYLFTGPRGTGKTSIARILAKTVNCANPEDGIACEKCPACQALDEAKTLDIIEIDAASNTGVDNIRELKETVALPPTSLKFKVYIIDEVHMLSSGAFNALLKTLEEPPTHVIFILATTEIHKIPETILSRCQRFDFTRLPIQNIIEKLSEIAKKEKLTVEPEALQMIALSAEGGMRDAETLFSQVIALEDKKITAKEVEDILGTTKLETVLEVIENILEKQSGEAIGKINSLLENGYDLSVFNKALINQLRQIMLLKVNPDLKKTFSFEATKEHLEKLIKISQKSELSEIIRAIDLFLEAQGKIMSFMLPQLPLEMAVIRATGVIPVMKNEESVRLPKAKTKSESPSDPPTATPEKKTETAKTDKIAQSKTPISQEKLDNLFDEARRNWKKLLLDIKPFNHSLNALLSNCKPIETKDNEIILATPYGFYKDKLDIPSNKLTVEEVFGKILGFQIRVSILVDKNVFPEKEAGEAERPGENQSLLDDALEIMGGKIVEE